MQSRVVLSNGCAFFVVEDRQKLGIASEAKDQPGVPDAWLCRISPDNKLVMSNTCQLKLSPRLQKSLDHCLQYGLAAQADKLRRDVLRLRKMFGLENSPKESLDTGKKTI